MLFSQADLKLFNMKLRIQFKINSFIILFILAQHMPFSINIRPEYTPEILSLIVYVVYSLNKENFGYFNVILIAVFNDIMKLHFMGMSVIQYLIYAIYIDSLKKKYSSMNLSIEWLGFFILNIILLPCKYSLLNFVQSHDAIFSILLVKKALVTIAYFPIVYYFMNKFTKIY
jgi:hypothetical protein